MPEYLLKDCLPRQDYPELLQNPRHVSNDSFHRRTRPQPRTTLELPRLWPVRFRNLPAACRRQGIIGSLGQEVAPPVFDTKGAVWRHRLPQGEPATVLEGKDRQYEEVCTSYVKKPFQVWISSSQV